MILRPPISSRTYTLFPYTTLFRSFIISTGGIACAWIGVGVSYPASLTAFNNSSDRPRSAKVIQMSGTGGSPPALEHAGEIGRALRKYRPLEIGRAHV